MYIFESIADNNLLSWNNVSNVCKYLWSFVSLNIFNNKSYLRHSYPLPIQRIDESKSSFINKETFGSTLLGEMIRKFGGEIIVEFVGLISELEIIFKTMKERENKRLKEDEQKNNLDESLFNLKLFN